MNQQKKMVITAMLAALGMLAGCSQSASSAAASAGTSDGVVQITLNGGTASVAGTGASVNGADVTITKAGTYRIAGALDDGQILVDAGKQDAVTLVLDGVTISCSDSAGIYEKQAGSMTLLLADGSSNVISDGAEYQFPDGGDEPDAAVFAKDDLTITGTGTLTVTGNYHNGIGSKDNLLVESGTLTVTAVNDGLRGRDSVTISDGTFAIDAEGDGIKSNNDEDTQKGWILLSGGSYQISAGNDGIQAETVLTVTGGSYEIVTGGGSENAPERVEQGFGGGFGEKRPKREAGATPPDGQTPGEARPGSVPPNRQDAEAVQTASVQFAADTEAAQPTSSTTDSESQKGMKAGTLLTVSGGTFSIDSVDDALHSNGNLTISGGDFRISTGDDGAHADGALAIEAGDIRIERSYEGLEGTTVEISGGEIVLTASDDGVNAAGGSDENLDPGRLASQNSYFIRVTGGMLTVDADGDGLDSNGDLYLEGGTVLVNGPTSGGDSALDYDGSCEISGGLLMATGSAGMMQVPSDGIQPRLAVWFDGVQPAGTQIELADDVNQTVLDVTLEKPFEVVILSAPGLEVGQTCALLVNGEKATDLTLTETVTSISSDGSAAPTQMRFGRMGMGEDRVEGRGKAMQ